MKGRETVKRFCFLEWGGGKKKNNKQQRGRDMSHDIPGLEQLDRELLDRHGGPAARAAFSSCNEKSGRRMRSEEAADDGSEQSLV